MMNELDLVKNEVEKLERVKRDLKEKKIKSFKELRFVSSIETILKSLDFSSLSTKQENQVWGYLKQKSFSFHHLVIRNSQTLRDTILRSLLQNSPDLKQLKVISCPKLTDRGFESLDETCQFVSQILLKN